jgi:hypothetical protein
VTKTGQGNVNSNDSATGLDRLAASARGEDGRRSGRPPIHLWNPAFCGDIDMRIASDGTWFYQGTPIGRPALVKLFASVLKHEPEENRHVLVTPVEKVGIVVEDAPFVAVEMRREEGPEQRLGFRTNVDDWTIAGPQVPLRFERDRHDGVKPYVLVRDALWARVARSLMYDLVDLGEIREVDGVATFGVTSGGAFFAIAPASELDAWA